MSTTELGTETQKKATTGVSMRFEATMLGVADVDRAKAFYGNLGWRLDADFELGGGSRIVQFTPPGSLASIQFGKGVTEMTPGSVDSLLLAVDDIVVARDELIGRGVDVSEIWHTEPDKGKVPGVDPQRRSYQSWAAFTDPDGNGWRMQELTERLPGRE